MKTWGTSKLRATGEITWEETEFSDHRFRARVAVIYLYCYIGLRPFVKMNTRLYLLDVSVQMYREGTNLHGSMERIAIMLAGYSTATRPIYRFKVSWQRPTTCVWSGKVLMLFSSSRQTWELRITDNNSTFLLVLLLFNTISVIICESFLINAPLYFKDLSIYFCVGIILILNENLKVTDRRVPVLNKMVIKLGITLLNFFLFFYNFDIIPTPVTNYINRS